MTCPPSLERRKTGGHACALPTLLIWSSCVFLPAARFRPSCSNSLSLPCERGRRESRALTAPVDPVRRSTRASHVRSTWAATTGTAETSRLSPRNGFTTYFVLSPVSGVFCHRCLRDILPQNRRHGRGARTTRLRRTQLCRRRAKKARHCCVHRIPARRNVTIARYVPF